MDELGRLDSPVHRLDPRAKAIATLSFIVVVMSFNRYAVSALIPFFMFPVLLLALGRIPLGPVLRKVAIAAPFALLVGAFNPLLDRQPMMEIGAWTVSGGWISFASIILRFALTVGAAVVLLATTGLYRLCAGMERMGAPSIFVGQVLFLYRYLFVLSEEGISMMRGVHLRSASAAIPLRIYGALVGTLLLRSLDRAERVYQAMVARGYDGTVRRMSVASFTWKDAVFVCGWLIFFVVARRWNLSALVGGLFMGGGR